MKRKLLLPLLFVFFVTGTRAAIVDTVTIYSDAMHKAIRCVVIEPQLIQDKKMNFPTLYLLHGYAGNFSNWITKVPALKTYADEQGILIVCPDGDFSSWYVDSPVDSSMRYETYIAREVPAYIDAHYPTIRDRRFRAITGLSMGGFGGLFLAMRHLDYFSACGSMSGGVDLSDSKKRFDVSKRIGDTVQYADNWKNLSIIHLVETLPKDSLHIIFDCGTEDFFYRANHALHEKMVQLKIPHDYTERPGKHDWNYWANSIEFQLLYFGEYFRHQRP